MKFSQSNCVVPDEATQNKRAALPVCAVPMSIQDRALALQKLFIVTPYKKGSLESLGFHSSLFSDRFLSISQQLDLSILKMSLASVLSSFNNAESRPKFTPIKSIFLHDLLKRIRLLIPDQDCTVLNELSIKLAQQFQVKTILDGLDPTLRRLLPPQLQDGIDLTLREGAELLRPFLEKVPTMKPSNNLRLLLLALEKTIIREELVRLGLPLKFTFDTLAEMQLSQLAPKLQRPPSKPSNLHSPGSRRRNPQRRVGFVTQSKATMTADYILNNEPPGTYLMERSRQQKSVIWSK